MCYDHLDKGAVAMELSPPPPGLEAEYEALFTSDSLHFLHDLISTFDKEVDEVRRLKIDLKEKQTNPFYPLPSSSGPVVTSVQKGPHGPFR